LPEQLTLVATFQIDFWQLIAAFPAASPTLVGASLHG